MFGIASKTKMENICQVATKFKKFLLADDESLAMRFSVELQTIHTHTHTHTCAHAQNTQARTKTHARVHIYTWNLGLHKQTYRPMQIKQAESYTKGRTDGWTLL